MRTARRILALVALVAGLHAVSGAAAQASFSDAATVTSSPMSISTATVAPVTNLVGNLKCASTSTMSATWTRSTSVRVSGYLVTVSFSDGYRQTAQLGPTATSWSATTSQYNVTAYAVRYSVTTQTDYGWAKESAPTQWFQC